MPRYATLQQKQRLELPLEPFARSRQHYRYRLSTPALGQACVVQLYHDVDWLAQQLPFLQQLIQQTATTTVGGFPLDVVLDVTGQTVGLLLPAVEGRVLVSEWPLLSRAEQYLLAYRLFLLAGQLEQQALPLVLDLSQFLVNETGQVAWQWNEAALGWTGQSITNYSAWWETLLPTLPLTTTAVPRTALDMAAFLLTAIPLVQAQIVLEKTLDSIAPLSETRLPIPVLTPLDPKKTIAAAVASTIDWPLLTFAKRPLSVHPLTARIETGIWGSSTCLLVLALGLAIAYVVWPALLVAYAQAYYALIGAWLVGGLLLLGLCLIGGSYTALQAARWISRQVQRQLPSIFYKTHPKLERATEHGVPPLALEAYHTQQTALQEEATRLNSACIRWQKATQQCQQHLIQVRSQANQQLERAYEHYRAAHWQVEQGQKRQLLQALKREQRKELAVQLKRSQELAVLKHLQEVYIAEIVQIKQRYWLAQTAPQQQWQTYKKQEEQLQQRLADWKARQQTHVATQQRMEKVAQAWTLEHYRQAL